MARPKILIVLTSTGTIPGTDQKTGWYLPEVAHPYEVLAPKADLTFASPKGGTAPVDPGSVERFTDEASVKFLKEHKDLYTQTGELAGFRGRASEFDAVFFPGGHGPMFDLATDADGQAITAEFWEAGKVVAAVCHGPAALVNVKLPGSGGGEYLLKGKRATCLANSEEEAVGMAGSVPFMLETEMTKRMGGGGGFEKAGDFESKVVVDGKLITGQNPASGTAIGKAIAEALGMW